MNITNLIKSFDSNVDKKTLVCSMYWMPNEYGEYINNRHEFLPLYNGSSVEFDTYIKSNAEYVDKYYNQFKTYGV